MIYLPIVQVRKIELKKSNVPESPKRPVSIVLDSLQVQDGMHSSLSEPSIQVCLLTWNKKIPFFLPLLNFCKMQVTYPKLVRKSRNFLFDKSDKLFFTPIHQKTLSFLHSGEQAKSFWEELPLTHWFNVCWNLCKSSSKLLQLSFCSLPYNLLYLKKWCL